MILNSKNLFRIPYLACYMHLFTQKNPFLTQISKRSTPTDLHHPDLKIFSAYAKRSLGLKMEKILQTIYSTSRYQLSPCGRAVSSLLPNCSFSLPETLVSCPTTDVETILLFIMHGCISIYQISNSPNFSPLKDTRSNSRC